MNTKRIMLAETLFIAAWPFVGHATDWKQVYDSEFKKYGNNYYSNPDARNLSWAEAYILNSLLDMYEVYRDRAYLNTFVTHADAIVGGMTDNDGDGYLGWNAPHYGNEKTFNGKFDSREPLLASIAPNGGFEDVDASDPTLPAGWTRWATSAYAFRSPTDPGSYDGAYATLLSTSAWSLLQFAWTSYKSDTQYLVSFEGRTNGLLQGRVDVRDDSDASKILATFYFNNTGWARQSFAFTTPAASGHALKIRFYYDNKMVVGGKVDFDDVRLSENLIRNGGFDRGGALPDGWEITYGDGTDIFRSTLDGDFLSGVAGVTIVKTKTSPLQYERILAQNFTGYTPSAAYTLSFWAKTNGVALGRMDVYDASGGQIKQMYFENTTWQRHVIPFTAPAVAGRTIQIRCFDEYPRKTTSRIQFDDVSLYKVDPTAGESGTVGSSWILQGNDRASYPSLNIPGRSANAAMVLAPSSVLEQTIQSHYVASWPYEISVLGQGNIRAEIRDGPSILGSQTMSLSSWVTPVKFRFKMPSAVDRPITLRLSNTGLGVAYLDDVSLKPASEYMVHYGRLGRQLARFANLVKTNSSLSAPYGAKAALYQDRVINHIIPRWDPYWRDLEGGKGVYVSPDDDSDNAPPGVTLPHNQYIVMVNLLLEAHDLTGNPAYLNRAVAMGKSFKSKLALNPTKPTAYVWNYSDDLKPDDAGRADLGAVEDTSHGNLDIAAAMALYKRGLVFDAADMDRFTSTFVDVMWMAGASPARTWDRVDGTDTRSNFFNYQSWTSLAVINSMAWSRVDTLLAAKRNSYALLDSFSQLCRWDPTRQTLTGTTLSDVNPISVGATSITWSWADRVDNELGFQVFRVSDGFELATLSSNTVAWTQIGLSPNSPSRVSVGAFGASPSTGLVGVSSTAYTLANPPRDLLATHTTATGVELAFSANGNPGGTIYELEQAEGAGAFAVVITTTSLTASLSGLSGPSTYKFRVRARNGDGIYSTYSNTFTISTSDGLSPSVSLTSPLPAANYTVPQDVIIQVAASDNVGVAKVWFLHNGVVMSTDTTAPYEYAWPVTGADNGAHTWAATAFDAMANSTTSSPVPVTVAIDTAPPTAPGTLTASEISSTTLRLSWTAATDNVGVTGYHVHRDTVLIGTGGGAVTSWVDAGLTPNTLYRYTVSALDAAGNTSDPSQELSVSTRRLPLISPLGSAGNITNRSVDLAWDLVPGADRYTAAAARVHSPASFDFLRDATDTTVSLTELAPNTTYFLFLNACDDAHCSDFSLVDSIVTQANVPALTKIDRQASDVQLTIDAQGNPPGTRYRVEVRRGNGTFSPQSEGTSLSPVLAGLALGETYQFRVVAINHQGLLTVPSNAQEVILPPDTVDSVRAYPVPYRPGLGVEGITFDRLPEEATIRIFSIDGRPVKTLTTLPLGNVLWDLTNDDGSPVTSGTYVVLIEKNGSKKRLKVVVQK